MFKNQQRWIIPTSPIKLIIWVALALVFFYNRACWSALHRLVELKGLELLTFYVSFAVFLAALITLLLNFFAFKYLDFPDLTRHLVALESNSTRGVYVRQAVY
jgi:glucan phosphoethanolaminetransferase (alkaline phosphatase superfamily)